MNVRRAAHRALRLVKALIPERYTERVRRAIQLANAHAKKLNLEVIGTECLLLGLIEEGTGVGVHALKKLNVDPAFIRNELTDRVQRGIVPPGVARLPMTRAAITAIEDAGAESRGLGHNYVGTEHLLLGLLHEKESLAADVLRKTGVTLEGARRAVRSVLGEDVDSESGSAPTRRVSGCSMCEVVATAHANPAFVVDLATASVFLAENQGSIGWSVLVLKDHQEHLAELDHDRQAQVWSDVARVAAAIRSVFPASGKGGGPPRINYECLGNLVPHIHWHVIPRHADDPEPTKAVWVWPEERLRGTMTAEERAELVGKLRDAIRGIVDEPGA